MCWEPLGKKFFQLFLWYFLQILGFYNKRMYWQTRISAFPLKSGLLNPKYSFPFPHLYFPCTSLPFLPVLHGFWLCSLSFILTFALTSIFICAFLWTLFSSPSAFFSTSFMFQPVLSTAVFVRGLSPGGHCSPPPASSSPCMLPPPPPSSPLLQGWLRAGRPWKSAIGTKLFLPSVIKGTQKQLLLLLFCVWTRLAYFVHIFPQNKLLLDEMHSAGRWFAWANSTSQGLDFGSLSSRKSSLHSVIP